MRVGVSIVLVAFGALLAFAVDATVAGIDVYVLGWVLMGAGILGIALSLIVFAPLRHDALVRARILDGGPRSGSPITTSNVVVRQSSDGKTI